MSAMYRLFALLAFSFAFAQLSFSQTLTLEAEAQMHLPTVAEEAQALEGPTAVMPVLHAFQNPGERSIHVQVSHLQGSADMNIALMAPNGRVIRNSRGYICTMCGTFDIDLEDEIGQGRYNVIVDVNGHQLIRTVWVE